MQITKPDAPLPILYLDHTAKMGGGEIALLNLIKALDRTRFEPVAALASQGPLAERLRAAGVETHVLPLSTAVVDTRKDSLGAGSLLQARKAAALLAYAVRLARFARRRGVAVIHANSLKSDIYGGLAGRMVGIPVIWHVRDSIDGEYLPGAVAAAFRLLCRVIPTKIIGNSQSTVNHLRLPHSKPATVVYSGSQDSQNGHVAVVHDGYDEAAFAPGSIVSGVGASPVVTLVGRIAPWKGQHVFLEAAARLRADYPRVRFWIVGAPLFGETEYEASLHALARERGLADRVVFWGQREDVPALLTQTDILVHASTLGEPFGQVVIEGMAAGKPVVATNGGALPEIVIPGETGLLVPMGDAVAMAGAIATLLDDPQRGRRMGEAGRRVLERFTIGHSARKVQEVYDVLLAVSPPTPSARQVSGGHS